MIMQAVRIRPLAVRCTIGATAAVYVLTGALALPAQARQSRTPAQGVYSADQAARGAALVDAQCVACHGAALEGTVGPALAGSSFLSAWAGRTAAELTDKIQMTMPLNAPGTLSRQQAIDIVADLLQASAFPAGQTALAADALSQVAFPGAAAAAPAVGAAVPLASVANLAQLMRGVTFPNANIIFNTQLKDPAQEKPKPPVTTSSGGRRSITGGRPSTRQHWPCRKRHRSS
jgi:mono/diheme cytochrome c family protein